MTETRSDRGSAHRRPRGDPSRTAIPGFEQPRRVEDVSLRPLRPLALDDADDGDVVEVRDSGRPCRRAVTQPAVVGDGVERLFLNPAADRRRQILDGPRRIVVRDAGVGELCQRLGDGRAGAASRGPRAQRCRRRPAAGAAARMPARLRVCCDAGAGSASGASSRVRAIAAAQRGQRLLPDRRATDRDHSPASGSRRAAIAQIPRVAQRAIERRDRRTRRLAVLSREPKVRRSKERESASRVNAAPTASRTRSSAAAVGSAASGNASNVWYGNPAAPNTSRAR